METVASFINQRFWSILNTPLNLITGKMGELQGNWQDISSPYFRNLSIMVWSPFLAS
jgi:hypothetical protein